MKRVSSYTAFLLATAAGLAAARADGGYYGGELGPRATGRSGAFTARADDPTAVLYNPAGLADVSGTVLMLGNRVSYNGYAFTREPTEDWGNAQNGMAPTVMFAEVTDGKPWQVLEPLLAVASNLGLRDWGFALAAFAEPGASRLTFPANGGQRYMMVDREAVFGEIAASAAWKWHDWFGVGATAEWIAVPRLNYSLVIDGSPFTQDAHPVSSPLDMLASTQGSDPFTFDAIVGGWVRPVPAFELGLSGEIVPAMIETSSTLAVTPVDPTVGTVALTRGGVAANGVTVRLPLPLTARLGARYRFLRGGVERFDIELDVDYETWSRVNQFTVDTHGLVATVQGSDVDLGTIAIAKHWRDTVAVKLGGDYVAIRDRLAVRAGASYETAVADAAWANVDFPGGAMLGGSMGASVWLGRFEVALAYQVRHQFEVGVDETRAAVFQQVPASACKPPFTDANSCNPHYIGQPSPAVNAGSYRATSHYVAVALLYRFGS